MSSNIPDKDKGFSSSINYSCFTCNAPICFTSTKDPITGKAIRLDLSTNEVHVCKPEDVESFKQTDERRKRMEEWLSKQKSSEEVSGSSTSTTGIAHGTSFNHDTTSNYNNNSIASALEQILTRIDHLEQMQKDSKDDTAAIKNALKIGIDRTPSAAGEAQT